jgi:hypothetical protein
MSLPEIVRSRAAEFGKAHKYVTSAEERARVGAAVEQLPEGSPYRAYLADLLPEDPGPYVPTAVKLAARVAELEQQLAGVSR